MAYSYYISATDWQMVARRDNVISITLRQVIIIIVIIIIYFA